jgi:hypothetical protein
MTTSRSAAFLTGLAFLWTSCGIADAQRLATSSPNASQLLLSLNFKNNGQHLTVAVGQQIEITLGTIGGPQYGKPEVSSPAVRLESTALWHTPGGPISPGGPTFIYIFEAAADGEAQVIVPIIGSNDPEWTKQHTFVITIRVGLARRNSLGLRASLMPDQSKAEPWKNAWTNLRNARQDFVPSLPRLAGVEVELVVANPGPESDEVTMSLGGTEGVLADISKTVSVAECSHVLFLLPKSGVQVVPGQVYSIVLNSDHNVFGWKYVADSHPKGAASLNGKLLSCDTHCTFLFRTFGRN